MNRVLSSRSRLGLAVNPYGAPLLEAIHKFRLHPALGLHEGCAMECSGARKLEEEGQAIGTSREHSRSFTWKLPSSQGTKIHLYESWKDPPGLHAGVLPPVRPTN